MSDSKSVLLPLEEGAATKYDMRRLDELTRPDSLDEVRPILRAHGYDMVGEGTFAYVWAKAEASTVLKIFTVRDKAFLAYANFVMRHQDNPHFPRYVGKLIRINDDWRAVRMERLTAMTDHDVIWDIGEYLNYQTRYSEWPDEPEKPAAFTAWPKLQAACDLIVDFLFENRVKHDIHEDNIMLRGSVPVLTDPVA